MILMKNWQYPQQPFVYETVFFLQAMGQIQISAAFTAASGLYMVLGILMSGQYDTLFCSLKNVLATTYLEMGATLTDLRFGCTALYSTYITLLFSTDNYKRHNLWQMLSSINIVML